MYNIGDVIPLYCEFKQGDAIVAPDCAEVRILHECGDSVYEDLEWTTMDRLDAGFVYSFDTFALIDQGHYVALFRSIYNNEQLKIIDGFDVKLRNIESVNSTLVYGFVVMMNSARPIKDVTIVINDVVDGQQVYQTKTDVDGRWEASVVPGDYSLTFTIADFTERKVRAQVGDHGGDVQFSTISLDRIADASLGTGLHEVSDVFTGKDDLGLANVNVSVSPISDATAVLASTTTDQRGRWRLFLDAGSYVLSVKLPSTTVKRFSMIVDGPGEPRLTELKSASTTVNRATVSAGTGSVKVNDVILDAHGVGVPNAVIDVYLAGSGDARVLVASVTTNTVGEFVLYLDHGRYLLSVNAGSFKAKEQVINV